MPRRAGAVRKRTGRSSGQKKKDPVTALKNRLFDLGFEGRAIEQLIQQEEKRVEAAYPNLGAEEKMERIVQGVQNKVAYVE